MHVNMYCTVVPYAGGVSGVHTSRKINKSSLTENLQTGFGSRLYTCRVTRDAATERY